VPTTRRQRTVRAGTDEVWDVVADPHHLPRWWPRVSRVEAVDEQRWTQVFMTKKGRPIRADYRLLASDAPSRRQWAQELEDSPFERVLAEAVTEVRLQPQDAGTQVTIELRQRMRGLSRLGAFMVRRASRRLLDEALEGLSVACER
jgi:carbon monoxide dehydrogenase subunit G